MDISLKVRTIVLVVVLILILIIIMVKQNKSDFYRGNTGNISGAMGKGMGMAISIVAGTGVALGLVLDNLALGIAIVPLLSGILITG